MLFLDLWLFVSLWKTRNQRWQESTRASWRARGEQLEGGTARKSAHMPKRLQHDVISKRRMKMSRLRTVSLRKLHWSRHYSTINHKRVTAWLIAQIARVLISEGMGEKLRVEDQATCDLFFFELALYPLLVRAMYTARRQDARGLSRHRRGKREADPKGTSVER